MILAWVLSVIAVFFLGYYLRNLKELVKTTQEALKTKVEKKPAEEPKSFLIDPLDEIQTAQYEMEKRNRMLNGE